MKAIRLHAILLLSLSFVLAQSCTEDFEEINTDPNNPIAISPALLLPYAIQTSVDRYWGHSTRYERLNIDGAMCWIQHLSRNIYINVEGDSYEIPLTISTATWNNIYNESLINFESVLRLSAPEGPFPNSNYTGVALTMKAFSFAFLTDVFGPIPYSQALKGTASEPINSPEYDAMEVIYAGLLEELKVANEKLVVGGPAISGDILFKGDILRWKKFANSLRLRLANHQASKKPEESRAIMREILADPATYPVFTGNNDFAELLHVDVIGSRNKMFDVFSTRSDWNMSRTLIDKLVALQDDRIKVYAQPIDDGSYAGLPNGLTDAAAGDFNVSRIGTKFLSPTAPSVLMTYSELLFIQAEAALDGDIIGDPVMLLEAAIKASFEQHGLTFPTDYMNRIGTVNKETIMTQKWIALFGQGVEAWTEYRRTGFPIMPVAHPNSVFSNEGILPTRIEYPTAEYSLNRDNLEEGLRKLGGDDNMRSPLWWKE